MMKKGISVLLVGVFLVGCAQATVAPTSESTIVPAAREPKHLEVTVVIEMHDMFFTDANGVKTNTFRIPSGKTVGIHIVNKGAIEHEIMFGRKLVQEANVPDGYTVSLMENVPADVFVYPSGNKIEVETGGMVEEIELEPGADLWLRVNFPAEAKGTWEIGCFVPGHYEAGMKAVFIIE